MTADTHQQSILNTIDRLYDTSTDVSKWDLAMEALSNLFDARAIHMGFFDWEGQQLAFNVHRGLEGLGPKEWAAVEKLLPSDLRHAVWERYPGKPHSCRMTVDLKAFHQSAFYKQVLLPGKCEYSLGVKLDPGDGTVAYTVIMRGPEAIAFDQSDCDLLGLLIPHIKRSLALYQRFANLDFETRAAYETLDQVSTGVALLREGGQVEFANRTARNLAEENDGLNFSKGRVLIDDQEASQQVLGSTEMAVVAARKGERLPGQSIALPRPSGARPYAAMVTPLWGKHLQAHQALTSKPVAAMFLSNPDQPTETSVELLERMFGLTPAEASVLNKIVAGCTVRQSAEHLSISEYTVRHHLKSVFDKTGTRRQSEVIRLVSASPLWRAHLDKPNQIRSHLG